jgi:hypothetical protein
MAYTHINFKNPVTGEMRRAPVGFSWTTLFFGCFPALFRSDWKWFAIMLVIAMITYGLSAFVFMFIYNKIHIKELINKGYKAVSIEDGNFDMANSKIGIEIPRFESAGN